MIRTIDFIFDLLNNYSPKCLSLGVIVQKQIEQSGWFSKNRLQHKVAVTRTVVSL